MSNEFVVSSGGSYDTLQAAIDAAQSNDTIFVEAGLYENETAVIDKDLEIVGVNGAAHFRSDGLIDNRKGILVVEGDYDLSVSNLILEGARVGDRNGAGIRFQGESLKVDNVKFVNNEMGILAGKSSDPSKARTLDVTNSVFEDNGGVDGHIGHGIYAFHLGHATITDSHFSGTRTGHHIKSRAFETTIEGNQLLDDGSNTSYNIDLPNQGHAVIRNNYIEQSAQSPNLKLINYGGETSGGSLATKPGSLLVENNAFINYAGKGTAVANRTSIDAELIDNAYYNISTRLSGDGSETGGRVLQQPQKVLAVDDSAVASAGDGVTIDLVGNDVGRDDQPLKIAGLGTPGHGTVVANGDGTVTYTPDPGFAGTDSFTYQVGDSGGSTDRGTVSLDVVTQGGNSVPEAGDDGGLVALDGSVTLDLLANDLDRDGDALTISGLGDPAHGSVTLNADGTVTYRPDAGYLGADSFTYTVSDGQGGSDRASVGVTVYDPSAAIPFDEAGLASYNGGQDVAGSAGVLNGGTTLQLTGNVWKKLPFSYQVSPDTVLAFDFRSDAKGELHAIGLETDDNWQTGASPFKVFGTQSGVFNDDHDTYSGNGSWQSYTIAVGAHQTGEIDAITFINDHDVSAPDAESLFSNVRLFESSGNRAPTANDDTATALADNAVTIDLLANDGDPDGDVLSFAGLDQPANGSLTDHGDGRVTYTPDAGFTGNDGFTYMISDGEGGSDSATATISVVDSAESLSFENVAFTSYSGGQDVNGGATVLDGGNRVDLHGNSWKKIGHDYDVTADTVLSFDFRADGLAELHAIGIDTDDDWHTGLLPFTLAGSQDSPFDNTYSDYGGGDWQSFAIRLGDHWTGKMSYLTFINDQDDGGADAVGQFRNIALFEDGAAQGMDQGGLTGIGPNPADDALLM